MRHLTREMATSQIPAEVVVQGTSPGIRTLGEITLYVVNVDNLQKGM